LCGEEKRSKKLKKNKNKRKRKDKEKEIKEIKKLGEKIN